MGRIRDGRADSGRVDEPQRIHARECPLNGQRGVREARQRRGGPGSTGTPAQTSGGRFSAGSSPILPGGGNRFRFPKKFFRDRLCQLHNKRLKAGVGSKVGYPPKLRNRALCFGLAPWPGIGPARRAVVGRGGLGRRRLVRSWTPARPGMVASARLPPTRRRRAAGRKPGSTLPKREHRSESAQNRRHLVRITEHSRSNPRKSLILLIS